MAKVSVSVYRVLVFLSVQWAAASHPWGSWRGRGGALTSPATPAPPSCGGQSPDQHCSSTTFYLWLSVCYMPGTAPDPREGQ